VRRQAGGAEDDVARQAEAVVVLPLLEADSEVGPGAVRGLSRGGELRAGVGDAVDARVPRDGKFEEEVPAALAEELTCRDAQLQAGEAAARTKLELELGRRKPADATAQVPEGSEGGAALPAHDEGGWFMLAARARREVDLVGERRRREQEQQGERAHGG